MAQSRSYVVSSMPQWERDVVDDTRAQHYDVYVAKNLRHDLTWSQYAPVPMDQNFATWKATEGTFMKTSEGKEIRISKPQKGTLNRAIKGGWFAYGWTHPPGSGRRDGSCKGPCCAGTAKKIYHVAESDDEEDGGKRRKKAQKPPAKVCDFEEECGDHFLWRFARAAFFAYFRERAEALRMAPQGGTGSGDAAGVF